MAWDLNRYTASIKNMVAQQTIWGVRETDQQPTLNLRQISVSKKPAGRLPTKYRSTKAPAMRDTAKWGRWDFQDTCLGGLKTDSNKKGTFF